MFNSIGQRKRHWLIRADAWRPLAGPGILPLADGAWGQGDSKERVGHGQGSTPGILGQQLQFSNLITGKPMSGPLLTPFYPAVVTTIAGSTTSCTYVILGTQQWPRQPQALLPLGLAVQWGAGEWWWRLHGDFPNYSEPQPFSTCRRVRAVTGKHSLKFWGLR